MTEFDRKKRFEAMLGTDDKNTFRGLLRDYILCRLGLPQETKETNLYYLVLYSVRIRMPDEDLKTLESRLATVDCHQTSYIVSKKTLLMMEIERGLSKHVSPDDADCADDIDKYAEVLLRAEAAL